MRLSALLDQPVLGLELLTGTRQLDREIRWVVTTDLLDPGRYLSGRELVLTGLMWRRGPEDSEHFVTALTNAGASALAAGDAAGGEEGGVIPDDLLQACRRHKLPLFRVPPKLAFATLTEHLARQLSAQRAGDITSVLERHSRLVTASAAGEALDPILELIAQDLALNCWVITSTGRTVAGSHDELDEEERTRLAHNAVRATRFPETVTTGKSRHRSVYAIGGANRLTDWYLVFDGEAKKWEPHHQSLATKVAAVLAVERARLEERDEPVRRLGEELAQLIAESGPEPEITARMRLLGLDPGGMFQAVAAATSPVTTSGSSAASAGPAAATSVASGSAAGLLRFVLSDIGAGRFAIAEIEGQAVAMVPTDALGSEAPLTGESLADRLRTTLLGLAPGLGRDRLSLGVSDHRSGTRGLRDAVEEAGHALRMSRSQPDQVSVVAHQELASHLLLLAAVPDDIRLAYRDRLLGPLRAYDSAHHSDLEATLESFLKCSTSWTRCAELMHVHVNTLRYRIARIEELTGRDLADLETQVDLFLALRLR